jgi:Rrf2 family protein
MITVMRISSKGEYGVRALFDLAQHYGQGLVQSDDIAERQGIPVNYLNQMLITLRRAGLIDSLRGPQGGHTLARSPEQITLLEALVVLEGPLILQDTTREDLTPSQPEDSEFVHEVWCQLRTALENTLQHITLEDLCQSKRQRTGNMMYYI